MKRALRRLDSVHQRLLETMRPLDTTRFQTKPSPDEWSVAEIVHHLSLVEERVIKDLQKGLTRGPQRLSLLRRFVPTFVVSLRIVRVKAPQAVDPGDIPSDKVECIERLNAARSDLKELCAAHGDRELRNVVFKHPFLGPINGVAAVSFVGHHENRHLKQIRETLQKLAN